MGKVTNFPSIAASDNCHIQNIRQALFLTQAEFADLIGVERRTVIRLENSPTRRSFAVTAKLLILQDVIAIAGVPNILAILVQAGRGCSAMSIAFQLHSALDL